MNTFHPYFYGDRIDLSSITDPLIKSTILGFVSNFGQVPKQVGMAAAAFILLYQEQAAHAWEREQGCSILLGVKGESAPAFRTRTR